MNEINYKGQVLNQSPDPDAPRQEREANQAARERANAEPEADLATARESATPDDDPDATLMD